MSTFSISKILVPTDFSENSLLALHQACLLSKITSAEIMLLHVIEAIPVTSDPRFTLPDLINFETGILDANNKHLKEIATTYQEKFSVTINTMSISGRTNREILEFCNKIKADLIVMGTHGISGFREFIAGSNTFRIVSDSLCPVLSVQQQTKSEGFKNILVPFRYKPHSREKVDYAIEIAKLYGAKLQVLGVDTDKSSEGLRRIELEGEQIQRIISGYGLSSNLKVISSDYRADIVLKYAQEVAADLVVVMADMDKDSLSEYFIGPFVQQVVNHSTIPVLSIRPKFNTDTVDLRFY